MIFKIPISITMGFAVIQVPLAYNFQNYNGKNTTGLHIPTYQTESSLKLTSMYVGLAAVICLW